MFVYASYQGNFTLYLTLIFLKKKRLEGEIKVLSQNLQILLSSRSKFPEENQGVEETEHYRSDVMHIFLLL